MKHIKWDKSANCYLLMMLILVSGCQTEKSVETEVSEIIGVKETQEETASLEQRLILYVEGAALEVVLESNPTTEALLKKMPFTVLMSDLNHNEKYVYLDESLPSNSKRVQQIKAGELMLFGSDCLVLFYEGHSSSYSYTKIGEIIDGGTIKNFLGKENVEVEFVLAE